MSLKKLAELQKNIDKKVNERKVVKQWLIGASTTADFTHEVTLTFPFDPKHTETAEKMYGIFKKRLKDRCYRKKEKKDINMAVVLEGEISGKRLHYHCAMSCPKHMSNGNFSYRIQSTWQDVVKSEYTRICFNKYTNDRWIGYMTKELDSRNTSVISEHTNF